MTSPTPTRPRRAAFAIIVLAVAAATAGATALLITIFERKAEQRTPYVRVVEVGEDDTDPAKWGKNWPAEYDSYRRTAITTRTRFGGHGGNEAVRYFTSGAVDIVMSAGWI